jgi:hypothetical protein
MWHFILTTQLDGQVRTVHGRVPVNPGGTESAALRTLLDNFGLPPDVVILFYRLMPDELG